MLRVEGVKIRFAHKNQKRKKSTACFISMGEGDDEVVVKGISKVFPTDEYDKETGRRLTLSRALQATQLTREQRTNVWQAYNAQKPGGRF